MVQNKNPETLEHSPPQRPDLGIETVMQAEAVTIPADMFDWIPEETTVPTVKLEIEGLETPVRYGSLVGEHHAVTKLASQVPEQQSKNAEQGMFKALVPLLTLQPVAHIEQVMGVGTDQTVYKTHKSGNDVARLFFTLIREEGKDPVLLKLGIVQHKKQEALTNLMKGQKKRRKHDG